MSRSDILKAERKISSSEITWCFISDYYDGPIEGLLYYRNSIWKFCCFREDVPDQMIYVILQLSKQDIALEIKAKERFEEMVGTHWSYDKYGNKLPDSGATEQTRDQFYKSKTESKEFTPYIHSIEAWFDVADTNA